MDCRNCQELLDPYLGDELSVETKHAVERHAGQCRECRVQLAARRDLRAAMRRAYQSVALSDEATARIRARLRDAAAQSAPHRPRRAAARAPAGRIFAGRLLARLFPFQLPLAAAAAGAALLVGAAVMFSILRPQPAYAAISPALVSEAAGDHDHCAAYYVGRREPFHEVMGARDYDPALADLNRVAEPHAEGLALHYAHVCGFAGRQFVHLIYTRGDGQLVSLLVTERNARALTAGAVPADDGLRAGLQHALHSQYTVSAYQTARHVVLVVSRLPQAESRAVAERVARPVSDHIRRIEVVQAGR
jgi:hypothetical protein